MNIESENDHIVKFIDGFESIIKQHKFRHLVDIGGTESYTVGVMHAEGVRADFVLGTENFITSGLAKLWEMVSNFVKGITGYFFSGERKAEKAKETANEIVKEVEETKKALNSRPSTPTPPAPATTKPAANNKSQSTPNPANAMAAEYTRIENINKQAGILKTQLEKAGAVWIVGVGDDGVKDLLKGHSIESLPSSVKSKIDAMVSAESKFNDIASQHRKIIERLDAHKVPEGNRLDKSALTAILDLAADYSKSVKSVFDEVKRFIDASSSVVDSLKGLHDVDEKEIAFVLKQLQKTNTVSGIRLKNAQGVVGKIHDAVKKIKDLL